MISSTTWSLTEMCKTHLNCERQDIEPDETPGYFDGSVSSPERLLNFVKHCELDAHYQMAIASRVQILPLTKQLTGLAGNAWYVLLLSNLGFDFGRGSQDDRSNSRPGMREKQDRYIPHVGNHASVFWPTSASSCSINRPAQLTFSWHCIQEQNFEWRSRGTERVHSIARVSPIEVHLS